MKHYDVIVIGAGFAGLTAARDLAEAGRDVLILEARDRIGGSTWYRPAALGGTGLEMGGTWVVPQQRHVCGEAERYAVPLTDAELPSRLTWSAGGTVLDTLLPVPPQQYGELEHALRSVLAASARIDPDRSLAEQDLADLDVPIRQWADAAGLTGQSRELVISWFCGCANANEETASALDVLRWLPAVDHSLWGMVEASVLGLTFTNGTLELAEAILKDSDAHLLLSSPVQAVLTDGDLATVSHQHGRARAARLLVTVPIGVLGDIAFDPPLSADKLAASAENHAGQGQKIWVLARNVPQDLSGVGWQTDFDYVGAVKRVQDAVVLVCFATQHDRVDPADLADVQRAVRQFAPAAEVMDACSHDWVNDPYSKGTWASFRAGQFGKYETALARPEGRVHFAGSHTGTRWRGFIDGAVESGQRSAAEILAVQEKQ